MYVTYRRGLMRMLVLDLLELRQSLGLTQREAAQLLEVAVNTWARWERGELGVHPERARQVRRLQQLVERFGEGPLWGLGRSWLAGRPRRDDCRRGARSVRLRPVRRAQTRHGRRRSWVNCARRCTLAPRRTTYPSPINWRPCVARSRQMSSGCQLSESSSTAASVVQRWLVRAWSACVSWLHIEASIVCTSNLLTAWRALARIKRCSCASSRRQALRWWLAIACGPSRPGEGLLMPEILAALYARVSSEQQADEHTIDSQVAALRTRVTEDGLLLPAEGEFLDEGYSGATLVRPALERLRDLIAAGGIDRLYVHSPDRLARRYAYQALLLDEFQSAGVEVVFINRALGQSPEDELLLQVQGMVAEYERAKILERSRRGKRHGAQVGMVSVLGCAPYGYRYIKKDEGSGAARFEIVLDEDRVVRQVFQWVGQERATIGEVA